MSEQKLNQEFDPNAWEADCRKYDINHEKLGFDVDITFEDGIVGNTHVLSNTLPIL